MTEASANPPISYEQARDELVALVQRLESGGAPLDESLALWERGEQLADDMPTMAGRRPRPHRSRPRRRLPHRRVLHVALRAALSTVSG